MEKANLQYVSGDMFPAFGLQPALGRLLSPNDDITPGAHPVAVISLRLLDAPLRPRSQSHRPKLSASATPSIEIVGVSQAPFTGTETGTMTDIFLPTMMHPGAVRKDSTWLRTFAIVQPGVATEPLRAKLDSISRAFETERANPGSTRLRRKSPASSIKLSYFSARRRRRFRLCSKTIAAPSLALGVLVPPGASHRLRQRRQPDDRPGRRARPRNGAARLHRRGTPASGPTRSSGKRHAGLSGRRHRRAFRLVGRAFRREPHQSARQSRTPGASGRLARVVSASARRWPVTCSSAWPRTSRFRHQARQRPQRRRRSARAAPPDALLIAAQVAFCFLVLFVAGLFVVTFDAFASAHGLFGGPDSDAHGVAHPQPPVVWEQLADRLRAVPGVERVAAGRMALARAATP